MSTVLRTQQDVIACTDMATLVATYNALTGKSVKRFESLDVGRTRTCNAILIAQDAAGHAGVPKGTKPTALTQDELAAKKAAPETEPKESEGSMDKKTKAPAAKKQRKAPAAKKPARKVAAPSAKTGRRAVYNRVKFTEPDVPRRPQEGSQRHKVLEALKKRKVANIDKLSEDVGFNARSFVHKLVGQGWAEVVGSDAA